MNNERKSPYLEVGLSAQKAVKLQIRSKVDCVKGLATAGRKLQRRGRRRARSCSVKKCGRLRQSGTLYCLYHEGGPFTGPRFAAQFKNWRRAAVTCV